MQLGFSTQRKLLLAQYENLESQSRAAQSRISRLVFSVDVVDSATGTAPGVAYAVARKNQVLTLFNYGVGDQIFLGGAGNVRATEADTNQGEGSRTNVPKTS